MRFSTLLSTSLFLLVLSISLDPVESFAQESSEWEYETIDRSVKAKGRELYFYSMRAWPFGKIPGSARLTALGEMEKMPRYSSGLSAAAEDSWRQLGPFTVGGRVRSIAVHPTDGRTLWIGAADGGIWKSTDAGASWTPQMQSENAISMGAVAVNPKDPDVLYAGTGELSSNVDAYTGAGIFKSTDGGESWGPIGLTNVGSFSRIAVRSDNPQIVYAGATKNNDGFYRSTDGGETWERTLESPVSDISISPDPGSPEEVWVALMSGGIRYSNDGGKTFTNRSGGIGGSGVSINRMSIDISQSDPSILYALAYETVGSSTQYSRIYKTTNGGLSWARVFDNDGGNDFLSNPGSPSQGWYNNVIAIKPDDPDFVVAGGVRMVRTQNGGDSWTTTGGNVHPDHHTMAFSTTDPNVLYEGNDGGMVISQNAGASFSVINEGLAISQFYAMAVDQKEDDLTYGGTQDNGTLTTTSPSYSAAVLGGDGFYVAVDPDNENIIYAEREYGQMYRVEDGRATRLYTSGDFPVANDLALWSAPLHLDPSDAQRLYSGRHKLYVSFNPRASEASVEWFEASPTIPGNISAFAISPHDNKVIILGSARGVVMRTTNETQNWDDLSFGRGLPNRAVTEVFFSRKDPNTVYIAYSGFFSDHIYKSTDLGESWVSISRSLPDIPVNALELHPEDENIIFAGTDLGMFITLDGGESWAVYNENLPRVAVVDLDVHLASGTLRAATHGRSMFERGIGGEPIEIAPSITSPHGGEVWTGGTPNLLGWGGFDDPEGVRVEYSLDDGRTWRELGNRVVGSVFRWNTVTATTIRARIKVTGMSRTDLVAVSNTFTIEEFGQGAVLNTDSKPTVPYGIAYDGEHLWTTDFGGNTLLKLDPETLDAVEVVTLGVEAGDSLFTDLTYYPPRQTLFLHRLNSTTEPNAGGVIMEVNRDGTVRGVWNSPAAYPIGLAWLGERNPDSEFTFLVASDRDGPQRYFFYEGDAFVPGSGVSPSFFIERDIRVESGPRGLAADVGRVWQVITDFAGGSLQSANAFEFSIETLQGQDPLCAVPLSSPQATTINGRGIEVDIRDRSLWLTDFGGNIYKMASCYTPPGPSDSGYVSSVDNLGAVTGGSGLSLQLSGPNPFSGTTSVRLDLKHRDHVSATLYDLNGRVVTRLAEGTFEAGEHRLSIAPGTHPSGEYVCEVRTGSGGRSVVRVVYLR